MPLKVNFPLILAIALACVLVAVLGISYFIIDDQQDQAYEETIQELIASPYALYDAQNDEELCQLQDQIAALQAKVKYQQISLSVQKGVIENLNKELDKCDKKDREIQRTSEELKDVRAILVNMTHAPAKEDVMPEQPDEYDDKSTDRIATQERPVVVEESVKPAQYTAGRKWKNRWEFGASVNPGVDVITRDFTVGAGVHVLLNQHALLGIDYYFREDIMALKIGWMF